MAEKNAPLSRSTPWRDVIILCRKCGKKCDGGFGPKRKETLKTALRQALRETGRRRQVRVMETACLGICPKNGVTALNATHPGTIHVIPAGMDAPAAVRTLLGDHAHGANTSGDGVEAA
jgi:predicted metal-binding protein